MSDFLRSKLGTLVLLAGVVLVGLATGKLLLQKYQVDKQISDLQARANKLQSDNQQLSDLINYLNTPQYQEKQAREQLNLQKPGEVVVGLPTDQSATAPQTAPPPPPNIPREWYDYFFHTNK